MPKPRPHANQPKRSVPDITRERQLQARGGPERACISCGLVEPEALRTVGPPLVTPHHVDGEVNSDLTADLCANEHILTQASLRLHLDLLARANYKSPFAQMAAAKFGRAAFWETFERREKAEGEWLLAADEAMTRKHGPKWWLTLSLPPFPGRIR